MSVFVLITDLTKEQVALVSPEDAELTLVKWSATNNRLCKQGIPKWYAVRGSNGKRRYLHREVFKRMRGRECRTGYVVDHINGDGLDCRRENLRECKQKKNMQAWRQARKVGK